MDDSIKADAHVGCVLAAQESKAPKQPYSSPVLHVYGSVRQVTLGSVGNNADLAGTKKNPKSNRAYKEKILRIGTHPLGIGIYLYEYKVDFRDAGSGLQFGVMADEVERVLPQALGLDERGFTTVNYEMLGITSPRRSV